MANDNIYRYPTDIDTTNTPYMIISAYPYDFTLQKAGNPGDKKNEKKDYKFHFISYVPKDIQYQNSPGYTNKKALGVSSINTEEGRAKMFAEGGINLVDTALKEYLGKMTKSIGLGDVYQTAKDQVGIGTGYWEDPRQVDVYQSPSFINQSFDFQLLANNKDEAEDVKLITTLFKYSAMPKRSFDKKLFGILPVLKSPMNFDMMVITPDGTTGGSKTKTLSLTYEYNYLNLKSVTIKPVTMNGREDVPFYIDGNTIGYDLKLAFSSMHPVIKPLTSGVDTTDGGTIQKALNILENNNEKDVTQKKVIKGIKGIKG